MKRLYEGEILFIKQDHTYYVDADGSAHKQMPSLSYVLKRKGLAPEYDGDIPPIVMRRAAARGDSVHAAVHAHLEGREWKVDDAHKVYVKNAITLIDRNKMVPQFVETPLYNPVFDYCCTPDFVGTLNGKPAIVDWKTTSMIHYQAGFQVAGQALCFRKPDEFALYVGDLKNGILRPFTPAETFLRATRNALDSYNEVQEIGEKYGQE